MCAWSRSREEHCPHTGHQCNAGRCTLSMMSSLWGRCMLPFITPLPTLLSTGVTIPIPQGAAFSLYTFLPLTHASQIPFNHIPARKVISMFHVFEHRTYGLVAQCSIHSAISTTVRLIFRLICICDVSSILLTVGILLAFNWLSCAGSANS